MFKTSALLRETRLRLFDSTSFGHIYLTLPDMLIYKDVISGDEMLSDAKEVDDVVYEVDCSMVVVKEGNVDIGANPSAEDADEALEDNAQTVNNIAHAFRLQATSFDKKSFLTYLKSYMKAVKAYLQKDNPDRVAVFEKNAAAFAKKIVANFKDYEFYTGESMDTDGMIALLNYRVDGFTPYFIFWKDGLKEEKMACLAFQIQLICFSKVALYCKALGTWVDFLSR
ncbi:Translationally-controlled tumor [Neolecta irregularis DAH-3]|uniref:Translationally-controlled tumor protein homolog n=1 Tax=Neolecta irregularis (strain DAH-3) TaxID=1198029 RepID=A0A1U7LTV7_NEOID|nr:Translationally-controlled tumor [Neolecta irregularis DAH-3]|eukprot:OLL26013.1 Translationally-controlled tumor [Neolecta irregularis DAH-3]